MAARQRPRPTELSEVKYPAVLHHTPSSSPVSTSYQRRRSPPLTCSVRLPLLPAVSMEPAAIPSGEDFPEDEDMLPKVPSVLPVDKQEIFALAAKELKLTIQEQKTVEINDDMYLTKIKIGNVLSKESQERETKEFSGKSAPTKKMSIQNPYAAAVQYLEDASMVIVDDHNASNVSRLKKELFCSDSWSMLFEYKAKKLSHTLATNNAKLRGFLLSFDSFYHDASASFALLDAAKNNTPPRKRARHQSIQQADSEDAALIVSRLSHSLVHLRGERLSLVSDQDHGDLHLHKETSTSDKESNQFTPTK